MMMKHKGFATHDSNLFLTQQNGDVVDILSLDKGCISMIYKSHVGIQRKCCIQKNNDSDDLIRVDAT